MVKVSIITATYNSEDTIKDTILSVQNQSLKDVEHIIVDGGSTDGTLDIIKKSAYKGLRYISEKDNGIYDALNKGVMMATGDVIGIIGSDDFYTNDSVLLNVARAFEQNNTDSLFGDIQYVNRDDTTKITRYWEAGEYEHSNFLKGWMPPHLSFFLKKDIYLKYGLYKPEFKISGDYELMLRVLYKHNITTQYLPGTMITMRNGGASTKNLKNRLMANKEDRLAWLINDLEPKFYTLILKPLLKTHQFFKRPG